MECPWVGWLLCGFRVGWIPQVRGSTSSESPPVHPSLLLLQVGLSWILRFPWRLHTLVEESQRKMFCLA